MDSNRSNHAYVNDNNKYLSNSKYSNKYNNDRGTKRFRDEHNEFQQNKKTNLQHMKNKKTTLNQEQSQRNFANKRLQCYRQCLNENKINVKHALPNTEVKCSSSSSSRVRIYDNEGQVQTHKKRSSIQNRLLRTEFPSSVNKNAASADPDVEEMDWESLDDNVALSEIQAVRQNIDLNEMYKPFLNSFSVSTMETKDVGNSNSKNIHVVVDTNVFISALHIVKEILNDSHKAEETPIILIPWMVTQELDFIKSKHSNRIIQNNAKIAVRFINECLTSKNLKLKGQSVSEAFHQKFSSADADDNILFCCLQTKEKGNRVVLLTNDVNLRNKALINDVPAYGKDEIVLYLHQYDSFSSNIIKSKIAEVKQHLSLLFSYIVIKEVMSAYGELWQNVTKINTSSPLSFEECLKIMEKYWVPVFSLHLQKQCLKTIQDIKQWLNQGMRCANQEEFMKFIELVLTVCFYLKNAYNVYLWSIERCVSSIEEVRRSV